MRPLSLVVTPFGGQVTEQADLNRLRDAAIAIGELATQHHNGLLSEAEYERLCEERYIDFFEYEAKP